MMKEWVRRNILCVKGKDASFSVSDLSQEKVYILLLGMAIWLCASPMTFQTSKWEIGILVQDWGCPQGYGRSKFFLESWSFNPATSFLVSESNACSERKTRSRYSLARGLCSIPQDSSSVHVQADPQPNLKAFLHLITDDKQSLVEENVQGK